jgi:hypothetical protein
MSGFARPAFLFLVMVLAGPALGQTVTFGTEALGIAPVAFDLELTGKGMVGVWAVVQDDGASGGRAFEQRTIDPTDYRFPLAIYRPTVARDVEASVRFKPISGKVDQAGGLAVRVLDANNYYVVRANALENNVNFYRVVSGRRLQIKGADAKVASGQWHSLALRAEGEKFTVSYDGRELFSATDRTFGGEGRVALWTKADSLTRFSDLTIKPLEGAQ